LLTRYAARDARPDPQSNVYGSAKTIATDWLCSYYAAMKDIRVVDRRGWRSAQQSAENSHRPFRKARAGHAAVSHMKTLQNFNSRATSQPLQSGASSRHPRHLQTKTLDGIGRGNVLSPPDRRLGLGKLWSPTAARRYSGNAICCRCSQGCDFGIVVEG